MYSPEESIVRLKLWRVSKSFYRATKEVVPYQLQQSQGKIDAIQAEMQAFEETKAFELSKEMPDLEARKQMMLKKADVQALKGMSAPPALVGETMALWLLLLDSFGVEVTAKSKALITEALQSPGSHRAKAQKYAQLGTWAATQTQLKDIRLMPKLQVLAEFMAEDPVNSDSFKVAAQYAVLYPDSINRDAVARCSSAAGGVAAFNRTIIQFQKKYAETFSDVKKYGHKKAMLGAVNKENEVIRIAERFLNLAPSAASPGSKKGQKGKKGKAA